MKKCFCFLVVALCVLAAAGDVLVGDLENGTKRNSLGGDWYYFFDAKDGGNSQILNAVQNPDGSYSDCIGDTVGYNSHRCAKLMYELGEKEISFDGDPLHTFGPFVGMGTDLAKPGKTVDLRNATSISFRARGTNNLQIKFELATANITDYGYYRAWVDVDTTWKLVTISLLQGPFIPGIYLNQSQWVLQFPLVSCLAAAQKINWQVAHGPDEGPNPPLKGSAGFLEIDDVTINGIDSIEEVPTRIMINSGARSRPNSFSPALMIDPLGRSISAVYNKHFAAASIYLWKTPEGVLKQTFSQRLQTTKNGYKGK